MILYFDTSSLLKLYLEEVGSPEMEQLAATGETLATSRVAYAEVRAGLARGKRLHRLSESSYQLVLESFEERWDSISVVELSDTLVRWAGDLAERHAMRGFDAIHLASALVLQVRIDRPVVFSAWDDRLMEASVNEGLAAPMKNA